MIKFDEEKVQQLAVDAIVTEFVNNEDFNSLAQIRINQKIDAVFSETVHALLSEEIGKAFNNALEKEYRKVDCFGRPEGEATSIRKELSKLTDAYWSQKVDKNGKPTASDYNSTSRAQYIMTQVCAEDFSAKMKEMTAAVTGHLKDSFRGRIARELDDLLDSLFRVKSLQDLGKVEKPW